MNSQYNFQAELQKLQKIITEKKQSPIINNKVTLDWKNAELILIQKIVSFPILNALIDMQKQCLKNKISCFYSYFIMQKCINNEDYCDLIKKETDEISQAKSKYHSIKAYIKVRQQLLGKINQFTGNNIKSLFQDIDDIRFLNFQIICSIKTWKNQWKIQGQQEPLFYDCNTNYLLKINNDNADMINLANFKKTKFISPPNPFFLSQDGNIQGMSSKQKQDINDSMDILNKERALDLKMSIEGGIFIVKKIQKNRQNTISQSKLRIQRSQNSIIRQANNQIQSIRQEQIRNIYKINKSLQNAKKKVTKQKQIEKIQMKMMNKEQKDIQKVNLHRSEKFLKATVANNIKQKIIKENKVNQSKINKYIYQYPTKSVEAKQSIDQQTSKIKQASKILREQVDKKIKKIYAPTNTAKKGVRQVKPKIKMIEQKQTNVEDNVKHVWDFLTSDMPKPLSRKNSTFYKKIQPIVQQTEDNIKNVTKPATQSGKIRSLTQNNFSLKKPINRYNYQKKQEQKSLNLIDQMSKMKNQQPARTQEEQIRNLNSQIRNLTIVNIYKAKSQSRKQRQKSHSSIKHQYSPSPQRLISSYITEAKKQEIALERSKLQSQFKNLQLQNYNQISKLSKQVQKKGGKKLMTQQILHQNQQKRQYVQEKLQQKTKIIKQLQQKIQELQLKKKQSKLKRQIGQKHNNQLQKYQKLNKIEIKLYKTKIEQQQQKIKKNKQMQLKIKQQQIKKQLKKNIQLLQQQNLQKKKLLLQKLAQEQSKIKQAQKLINQQKNKFKQMQIQLQHKKLKQKLLKRILEEKQQKLKQQQKLQLNQSMVIKKINAQINQKSQLQQQNLKRIQEQKQRIKMIYEEMIQKNKRIQEQNKKKIQQLEELDRAHQRQAQQIRLLQESFNQINLRNKNQIISLQYSNNQERKENNIEELKIKIKKELLQQLQKQKQKEEQQERQENERRTLRLKKIEAEVAEVLRAQQEELQKQNALFLQKIQDMKNKYQITASPQNIQNLQEKYQAAEIEEKQNKKEIVDEKQIQLYQMQIKRSSSSQENTQKIEQNSPEKSRLHQNNEIPIQQQNVIIVDQIQKKQSKNDENLLQNNNSQAVRQQKLKATGQNTYQKLKKEVLSPESKRQEETKNQAKDLRQKYNKLSQYIKKTKQLLIEDLHISTFIDNFISHLQKPARQMLPYTKIQLQKIFINKKVDIFQFNSIGWIEEKGKYTLLGGIQCVDVIIKKYGAVQINQLYIFDKTSAYQKQFLGKKIKIFQNIGFVYQKKIQGSNKFSVRFVIKVPKDIAKEPIDLKIKLQTIIKLQNYQDFSTQSCKNYSSYSYIFSRILKQNANDNAIELIEQSSQAFKKTIQKQLKFGPIMNKFKFFEMEVINDNIGEINVHLNLKYYRNYQRAYYLLKCTQYNLQDNHYYISYLEQGLAILLQQYRQNNLPLDHILFNSLQNIQKAQRLKQIDVCLPIWSINSQTFEENDIKYCYQQKLSFQMPLSSICSTFLIKHEYIQIRAPFVFAICESKQKKLIRPLTGQVVLQNQLIHQNLKLQ